MKNKKKVQKRSPTSIKKQNYRSLDQRQRNRSRRLKDYLNRSQKKKQTRQKEQDILEYLDYQEEARAQREQAIKDRKRQIKNELIRKYSRIKFLKYYFVF